MKLLTCALPGCDNPLLPGRVPFGLGGNPEKYCSRGCVTIAFELMRKQKKFKKAQPKEVDYIKQDELEEMREGEEDVKVKASEFGGAEVYRRYCDNPACKGPITVSWKGRRGEYCSNSCLKTEKENTIMADIETNEASPIAAGAPATKKGKGKPGKSGSKKTYHAKKAGAAAPAKKAAKKAPAANGNGNGDRTTFPKDGVIKLAKKFDHGRTGKAGDAFDALKDGITVEKYREVVNKKNPKNGSWYAGFTLKFAVAEGWITIK